MYFSTKSSFYKKILFIFSILILSIGVIASMLIYHRYFRGAGPAIKNPVDDIVKIIEESNPTSAVTTTDSSSSNTTNFPLKLPSGFSISVFAKNLPGARVITFGYGGNMWVSQTSEGKITELIIQNDKVANTITRFSNLNRPHGLIFSSESPGNELFFAEEHKISRVLLDTEDKGSKVIDLPKGARHFTRTLGFGPDGRLYVSIGSTCDTCYEKDPRHAAIYSMNKDGSDFKLFAKGLRNSVFFTWHPETKQMWTTEMGRDFLGDNLPPEEINIIEQGKDYGWPICYGKNIQDTKFDPKNYVVSPCTDKIPSYIDMPAHSAPLGLAFIPGNSKWPEEYWYNLLVAFHGSWNRTEPDGYKIIRLKLDKQGNYLGTEDFISGWLTSNGALGRPVDILVQSNGTMYVSDDKAGVIYKISSNN